MERRKRVPICTPGGTHEESRSDSTSVYDAAGCDDRDLDLGEDVFEKSHEGDLAVMAAGFHAFDDDGIRFLRLYASLPHCIRLFDLMTSCLFLCGRV